MASLITRLRPTWLRPPALPLGYLLLVALPLAIWQSPGTNPAATCILVASLALLILVGATARSAPLAWAWIFFAAGAAFAMFHDRIRDNELAGVMLLFLPLAASLVWCRSLARVRRLQSGLLALLYGGTLLAAGSRGAVLALLGAGGVTLMLERRWRWLALGVLPAAGLLAMPGAIDWLLHDGKAQGLTLDSLLTGRPEIWRHSLHAVADFSWTGIGIGTFPRVVPALYYPPGVRHLEDAHSLVIQTALDLGIGGLLAIVAIVWLGFRQARSAWRRAPGPGLERAWAAGLFASLLAFCAFNLFDAIALGSAGSLPFSVLLGLIYALPKPRAGRRRWRLPARGRHRVLVGILFMLLGLSSIRGARQLGAAAVLGARAILDDPGLFPAAHAALDAASHNTCRAGWLAGKVAQVWGRPDLRDAAWSKLLRCSVAFVPMIAGELPAHRRLAEQAIEVQPSSAEAHLWLARIRARDSDPEGAQDLYRRSLELDPGSGAAWLELGHLLAPADPRAALAAYAESCRRGDPGANACPAAGAMAERLGEVGAAIGYYRQSRLASARQRAKRLADPGP